DENGFGEEPDIAGFAALSDSATLTILIYNHHDDWNMQADYPISVQIDNLPYASAGVTIRHYRIDQVNSNAYAEWMRQGKPMYPTPEQRQAIKARDQIEQIGPVQTRPLTNGTVQLDFTLPVH